MHAGADDARDAAEFRSRALLDAWERGAGERPAERAITLLVAGGAGSAVELSELSVGARDQRLLELRRSLFGGQIAALVACPGCAEAVELEFDLDAIVVTSQPAEPPATVDVAAGAQTLRVRVPTAADLAAAGDQAHPQTARAALLDALLTEGPEGPPPAAAALDEPTIALIDRALAAADPQADVELAGACPACATAWQCPLDVGAFVWSEVEDWAARLLLDVHALATAYGWREADALALSPTRRRFYVEAARA